MAKSKPEEVSVKTEAESSEKKCFIIMPIADHPEYETGHFNRVYEYLIKPACIKAGYKPYRADDSKASHMIMFDILKQITECDMAICDLSSKNANVFYELGLRQAFNKKTILITDGKDKPPFDIAGFRYVPYTDTLRVDSVRIEIDSIVEMLHETENAPDDDVNSIVKLLKIKPANIEPVNLNESESIVFKMFNQLQSQIERLAIQQKPLTVTSNREQRKIASIPPWIINFQDAITNLDSDILRSITFTYGDKDLGHFVKENGNAIYFRNGTNHFRFEKSSSVMENIKIEQLWYF